MINKARAEQVGAVGGWMGRCGCLCQGVWVWAFGCERECVWGKSWRGAGCRLR